jgi:acetyl esterase/lipase
LPFLLFHYSRRRSAAPALGDSLQLARLALLFVALLLPTVALAQPPAPRSFPLWPAWALASDPRRAEPEVVKDYWVRNVHVPSVTVFQPDPRHRNGAAIVVFPGGGHKILVWTTEGTRVGEALTRYGLTIFVVKYRLAEEEGSHFDVERDAAADARRAVRWVRAHAGEFGIDPARVGAMGFSAGGELVSLIADNFDPPDPLAAVASRTAPDGAASRMAPDAVARQSARPDFQILVFPGPRGIPGKAVEHAPPAFIVAGSRDECCAAPAVALYEQLRKAGVSAELHMYAEGRHAFNLDESDRISILHWPDRLADWLADGGWLDGRRGDSLLAVPVPAARTGTVR